MGKVSLDNENRSQSSLCLRMPELIGGDKVGRDCAELNALKSVERSVGHVIDHVNDVIVSDKLANNMGTNKAASARDKGTFVIHILPREKMVTLKLCAKDMKSGELMIL